MSLYQLIPGPDVAGKEEFYAYWENAFSQDQLQSLIVMGNKQAELNGKTAVIGDGSVSNIRKSKIAWFSCNEETSWLYDKLGFIARQINAQYFQFDLYGFVEDVQYTIYDSNDQGHYDWHVDKGYSNGVAPRKLSMVLQLSDPTEYEGGDLELQGGNGSQTVAKTQGLVHIFPSWVLHRVTPVTRGSRRTIVVWLAGPKFR